MGFNNNVAAGLLASKFAEVGLVVERDPLSIREGGNYNDQYVSDLVDIEHLRRRASSWSCQEHLTRRLVLQDV